MAGRPVGVTDTANATGIAEIDVVERASPDLTTTTTADPGSGGTTLAVTANAKFPGSGSYKIRVEAEVMLVTAGQGTNSWTVTRGQDNTTAVAHTTGVVVAYVVAVQRVEPVVASKQVTYLGRAATFATLGRAGTTGQKIFAIHNSTTSLVLVDVLKIVVDTMQTAARVVEPPKIRLWKFTAVPTNGSAVTKVPEDSALASNAQVTVWQDSSADDTGSGTTLTVTLPAATVVEETWGARALTLVGYEQFDNAVFLQDTEEIITLRALEGLCVFLGYTVATANPITDKYLVTCRWIEYTPA